MAQIDPALEKLNAAWTAASEELYKAMNDGQNPAGNPFENMGADNPFAGNSSNTGDPNAQSAQDNDVTDADFEEVEEETK